MTVIENVASGAGEALSLTSSSFSNRRKSFARRTGSRYPAGGSHAPLPQYYTLPGHFTGVTVRELREFGKLHAIESITCLFTIPAGGSYGARSLEVPFDPGLPSWALLWRAYGAGESFVQDSFWAVFCALVNVCCLLPTTNYQLLTPRLLVFTTCPYDSSDVRPGPPQRSAGRGGTGVWTCPVSAEGNGGPRRGKTE